MVDNDSSRQSYRNGKHIGYYQELGKEKQSHNGSDVFCGDSVNASEINE